MAKKQRSAKKEHWKGLYSLIMVVLVLGTLVLNWLMPLPLVTITWLLTMASMVVLAMIAGFGLNGRFYFGWMINEENRNSLSRLQMFLWTVVVISAFFVIGVVNVRVHRADPLAIEVPEEVWLAMGISTVSLVGTPLISSKKRQQKPTAASVSLTEGEADGVLAKNKSPKDARLYEIFSNDEALYRDKLDLSKLQNLYFTVLLVGAYAISIYALLLQPAGEGLGALPTLGEGSLALLAISHAGYLTKKAITDTPTTDTSTP